MRYSPISARLPKTLHEFHHDGAKDTTTAVNVGPKSSVVHVVSLW